MKIFLDANILVATLNREYPLYPWAARVLSLQGKGRIRICTSPLCLAIAFYFASKKSGERAAKKKIELLCRNLEITSMDETITHKAVSNPDINDFEDGLEYYAALNHGCSWLITEDRNDFWFSELKIAGCEEFLSLMHNR
jgi:predicted nucleic acid-binding protein